MGLAETMTQQSFHHDCDLSRSKLKQGREAELELYLAGVFLSAGKNTAHYLIPASIRQFTENMCTHTASTSEERLSYLL